MKASDGAMMIPELWCGCASTAGADENCGSSLSATFMRNVPDPQRQ